jgi:hypothetical protein
VNIPVGATKVFGWLFRGGQAAYNAFATWTTRVRVSAFVGDYALFGPNGTGLKYRVLWIQITASEKADLSPVRLELGIRGRKASPLNIKDRVVLPHVVPANRTEKIPLSGTTLDDILTAVGEARASLQVEITVVDHYDRRFRSGWVDVDRADLRKESYL